MKRKRYIFIFDLLITLNTLLGNSIHTRLHSIRIIKYIKKNEFRFYSKNFK